MGFIQQPGFQPLAGSAGIAHFEQIVGVELDNPKSANVNGGDISILSDWNLGAEDSNGNPVFRTNENALGNPVLRTAQGNLVAPHITFRAGGSISIKASITDGFHQIAPIAAASAPAPAGALDYWSYNTLTDQLNNVIGTVAGFTFDDFGISLGGISINEAAYAEMFPALPSALGLANMDVRDGYYGTYELYNNDYLNFYLGAVFDFNFGVGGATPPASVLNCWPRPTLPMAAFPAMVLTSRPTKITLPLREIGASALMAHLRPMCRSHPRRRRSSRSRRPPCRLRRRRTRPMRSTALTMRRPSRE